jgi:hypothetical protein
MGSREFEYNKNWKCDNCGREGAFDIYGDFICAQCLIDEEDERDEEEECEHLHVEDLGAGNDPRLDCLDCGRTGYMVFEGD